ncbi:MAG: hypothetical protein ACOC16_00140 [Nanoarchaeota archaeon]
MNNNLKKFGIMLILLSIFLTIPYLFTKNIGLSVLIALIALVVVK